MIMITYNIMNFKSSIKHKANNQSTRLQTTYKIEHIKYLVTLGFIVLLCPLDSGVQLVSLKS